MNNKKRRIMNAKRISIIMVAFILLSSIFNISYAEDRELILEDEHYQSILEIVEENYYKDMPEIPKDNRNVYKIFEELDPHSDYYPVDKFEKLNETIQGKSTGIGVKIKKNEKGHILIDKVIKGSPADEAGLKKGSRIFTIDGYIVSREPLEEVAEMLKGVSNTETRVRVNQDGLVRDKKITRRDTMIDPVQSAIAADMGYIRLESFNTLSYSSMEKALENMDEEGIDKIILDLRNNPGGYLQSAIQIAELFVKKGPITHLQYKNQDIISYTSDNTKGSKYKLVVLVNENSASASEVLAGAIQDRKAGKIVGNMTYGKGTVQEIIQLPEGDGVKLTIGEYFSPHMNKIDGVGIVPDVLVTNEADEDTQLIQAMAELLDYK